MTTYISLLRGINVGGRIVRMADLKACYEEAGCTHVTTLLQSGNVVFQSPLKTTESVRSHLEKAVSQRFGYTAHIFVLTAVELNAIINAYPFDTTDNDFQHYVITLRSGLAKQLADHATNLNPSDESVALGTDSVYWKVRKGMTLKSTFAQHLTKQPFKDAHTNRNLNTLRKLLALQ